MENVSAVTKGGESTMSQYTSNAATVYSPDAVSNVFEPDFMLPSQFLVPDEQGLTGGERRLMAALLSDGIEAYIAHQTSLRTVAAVNVATGSTTGAFSGNRGRCDAQEWVDTVDESYVFSFDNVCESLGINPHYLRLGLSRYIACIREARESGSNPKASWKKIRRPRKQ